MKNILYPFLMLAAVGLALSLIVHINSLFGAANPLGERAWLLHVGIFIVWLPAVLVVNNLARNFKRKDLWRASLRGCPRWMKLMVYFFFGYALVNFIMVMFVHTGSGNALPNGGSHSHDFRGFSGHWMVFYATALALMYSYIKVKSNENKESV
jgi:hypothetical protein